MPPPPSGLAAALADRYRLERQLGEGGMATVYLAEDLKHRRQVAVKVLRPELAAVLGAERFVQEITTTASLQHPHILPLFDSGEASGFLYYVMPYIEGETLRARLDRETQLGIEEAVRITTEVADALDYAHRHGVIHRDIKPENILLHDGRPMVADFGIALAVSAAAGGRMTETGLSLGTPHYMSPEQATAEKEITGRSDIYSLGSVLYETLAGNPPHVGSSAQQVIMKIVTEEAAPVGKLRKAVPPNVAAAVAKALEKLPADRFASAAEFAAALANPRFTTAMMAAVGRRPPDWRHRAALPLAGAAAVLLVAAAWGWSRPGPETAPPGWRVGLTLSDSVTLGLGMSLSRDGSVLVFAGQDRIWKRSADAPRPIPVAGTEQGSWPALSPDGKRIAFLPRSARGLRVVPLDGGTPREVPAKVDLVAPHAWLDGDHIVYSMVAGLVRLSVTGGEPAPLTSAAGEGYHVMPSPLPGGGVVFVIVSQERLDSAVVAVVGPEGGAHTVLMAGAMVQYAHPGHLVVTRRDGAIVAVPFDPKGRRLTGAPVTIVSNLRTGVFSSVGTTAVSWNGRLVYVADGGQSEAPSDLVWVTRAGAATPVAPEWMGHFQSVAISPDRRRAAVGVITDRSEEMWVRDLGSGSMVRYEIPGAQTRDPTFGYSGNTLFFAVLGIARHGVFAVDPAAGGEPALAGPSDQLAVSHPGPSADGRLLYYVSGDGAAERLLAAHLGSERVDTIPLRGSLSNPRPSPDGRWLAYTSDESGRSMVYVRSTDPRRSEQWPVSRGVLAPFATVRWSPKGDELYWVANDSLIAVQVSSGATLRVTGRRALFPASEYKAAFDVASDGRFVMIRSRPDRRPPTELVMVERWWDGLPGR